MSAEVPMKTGGGPMGRNVGTGGTGPQTGGDVTTVQHVSRQGSVVIRATVEHIGVVGDTEMTVHVKWPASSFCPAYSEATSGSGVQSSDAATVPDNGPGAYILKAKPPDDSMGTESENRHARGSSGRTEYQGTGRQDDAADAQGERNAEEDQSASSKGKSRPR